MKLVIPIDSKYFIVSSFTILSNSLAIVLLIFNDVSCNFNFVGDIYNNIYNNFTNSSYISNNGIMTFGAATDFVKGPIDDITTILYNGNGNIPGNIGIIKNNGIIYCNYPVSTYCVQTTGSTISPNNVVTIIN